MANTSWLKRQFFLLTGELISCLVYPCAEEGGLEPESPQLNSYPQEGFLGSGAFVKDGDSIRK